MRVFSQNGPVDTTELLIAALEYHIKDCIVIAEWLEVTGNDHEAAYFRKLAQGSTDHLKSVKEIR